MNVKKINIGIKSLNESLEDFTDTWKKLESGKKVKKEEGIYFESIDAVRSVLTNNRLLILKTIKEKHPKSIYELSKMLGRNLKNVNQDLDMLCRIGLVELKKEKTDKDRVIPFVNYNEIMVAISL
ncbi:MAG: ArsR family transcriptional regulator [Candidatus Acididesulfobacter diazotrophicus]|jgi:predicted transcriptional regulator|uniref:ArsR family transcriptional regulator n=1 Tax=Candidatus Acididesulfobacter diazotrophicus TaxID=2597226 RepID=A0A519BNB6_9DELT|nr:MAG: ArsR family transcriptional regulator [Candidatus Acididesulfobacter diazotrophicus]